MKFRELGTLIVFMVIALFILGCGIVAYLRFQNNLYDGISEKILKEETGIEVDSTPVSQIVEGRITYV